MKVAVLRWMIRHFEKRRWYISSYFGLVFAGYLKLSVLGEQRAAERKAGELAATVGRADLLIRLLRERVGMK